MIVDVSATGLEDENVLVSDRLFDLDAYFSIREFVDDTDGKGDAQSAVKERNQYHLLIEINE